MLKQGIDDYGDHSAEIFSNDNDSTILVRSAFKDFEGETTTSPYIRIALNLGGGGLVKHWVGNKLIEVEWRRGSIIVCSGEACFSQYPSVDMLGLALNVEQQDWLKHSSFSETALKIKPLQSINDDFLSAMLIALWQSAKTYGVSTLFFEQGVQQVLKRTLLENSQPIRHENRRRLTRRALTRIEGFIEQNLHSDLSVAKMAKLLEMDETSFAKSFLCSTGQTPFSYITEQRVKQAQGLLKLGYKVTDAAISVGYSNPSKFAAAFRRHVGIAPSAWRKNANNKPNLY